MTTRLIKLADGTLVEVEASSGYERISGSGVAKQVDTAIDAINPIIIKTAQSISNIWHEVNKDLSLEQAEIEFGVSFEGEGNIYVTKAKAGANLTIKLTLKPKE
jgi:hypothetical protein